MDNTNLVALVTMLVSLPIGRINALGAALVATMGKETAQAFLALLSSSVDSADSADTSSQGDYGVHVLVTEMQCKIGAIKAVRAIMGTSLKNAKLLVERAYELAEKDSDYVSIFCDLGVNRVEAAKIAGAVANDKYIQQRSMEVTPYYSPDGPPPQSKLLSSHAMSTGLSLQDAGFNIPF